MSVSVTNSGGTLYINDGNSVFYPQKDKISVSTSGNNVIIRWDEVHYVTFPYTDYTAPSGASATAVAALIAAFLDSGADVSGSGTANYIPKWTASTTLGNSLLFSGTTAIGLGTATPDATSVLDITSTTLGVLLPRLTTTQQNAIVTPATSLLIFNTSTGLFHFYTGAAWVALDTGTNDYTQGGNAYAATGTLGLTDSNILNIITNNLTRIAIGAAGAVGIGMTAVNLLDVGKNQNASTTVGVNNTTAGTGSLVAFTMTSDTASGYIATWSSTATNPVVRNATTLVSTGGNLLLQADSSFYTYILNGFVGINVTPPTAPAATLEVIQYVGTSGSPSAIKVSGGAHTTLTAAEVIDVNYAINRTVQFTGNTGFATQRAFLIQAPTYAFASATGTITTAATLAISAAPIVGANAAITNALALWVQSGETRLVGSGTGTTTFSLRAYNSTPTLMLGVRDDGHISAGVALGSLTIGLGAGFVATVVDNTFVGVSSGAPITTGANNTGFGATSLASITTGAYNTAVGRQALSANSTGNYNTAVGHQALTAATGASNSAFGLSALSGNTTGIRNSGFGESAGGAITTGIENVILGYQSGLGTTTGSNNTILGIRAGNNGNGTSRVFIGNEAGYYETGNSKLFIDNISRANEADGRLKTLVYGIFAYTPVAQTFRVNGNIETAASLNNKAKINVLLYGDTTDAATAVELTTDGAAANGTVNRIVCPADTAMSVVINIAVKQTASANSKQMLRQFVIVNNGGTTSIAGAVAVLGTDSGSAGLATVTCTITANDTDDAIKVEVNGVIATNLRYSAYLVSTETLYA